MNPPDPNGRSRYEILKIWIPTHGVVNIYRNPRGGYEIHNGYLAEKRKGYSHGRRYDRLTIVTPRGKKIVVRRYEDDGDIRRTRFPDHPSTTRRIRNANTRLLVPEGIMRLKFVKALPRRTKNLSLY
ncbi:hypothetical protein AWC38_SpisGene19885 [Stylophora pistillata]|uniref:Uncharacterized protein n=1 Tax=Stylophora pistillata TaxID=50429 RepID=A0A2B4RHY3_STYPI|nr:hypothetical protein AWC38_SpisGene19885 [Stylophora pistillata]